MYVNYVAKFALHQECNYICGTIYLLPGVQITHSIPSTEIYFVYCTSKL